mgnify:FL=1
MSPILYEQYPKNWKTEIRPFILKRANNCCEKCFVKNYSYGWRDAEGNFNLATEKEIESGISDNDKKIIKIVLTISHLDHDESNHEVKMDRLEALCQRCHLKYDVEEKRRRRIIKLAESKLWG